MWIRCCFDARCHGLESPVQYFFPRSISKAAEGATMAGAARIIGVHLNANRFALASFPKHNQVSSLYLIKYIHSHQEGNKIMKQKIVIKVQMNCNKCRTKALQIAAAADGVESVSLEGEDKTQVVVIGVVDAVSLTSSLRKKVGHAEIASIAEVKPGNKEKENKEKENEVKIVPINYYDYQPYWRYHHHYY